MTSLGSLLAPSGEPFRSPWGYLGAPWPHFWHAKAPLERDFTNLGLPSHLSGRIFNRISMIFHEFWWTFPAFSVWGFSYFLIQICLNFLVYFQSLLTCPRHPCQHVSEPLSLVIPVARTDGQNQYTTVMLAIMTMNTWSTCAFFFVEPQWIFLIDAENWTEIGLSFVLDCCALQEKWRNDVPRAWLFRPVKTYYQYGSWTWAHLAQLGQLGPNLAQLGQLGPAHPNIRVSKPPSLMRPRRDTRSANNLLFNNYYHIPYIRY